MHIFTTVFLLGLVVIGLDIFWRIEFGMVFYGLIWANDFTCMNYLQNIAKDFIDDKLALV